MAQKGASKWGRNDTKMMPKRCQNDRKWPQNDHGSAQKWSKITQKETHFGPILGHFIWHLQCFAAENVLSVGGKTSCRLQLSAPFQPSIYRIASAAVHHVQGLVTQIPESAEEFVLKLAKTRASNPQSCKISATSFEELAGNANSNALRSKRAQKASIFNFSR